MILQCIFFKNLRCTTPFGPNKSNICTNEISGMNAMNIYRNNFYEEKYGGCFNPCSFFSITTTKTMYKEIKSMFGRAIKHSQLKIHFEEIIKVTNGYYLYSGLSLIAEIGGYVGLFLGVSVNQITDLMEALLSKFD